MNAKLETALNNASKQLSGECVELEEELIVKYEIGEKEYTDRLAAGCRVDKNIVFDDGFRYKFVKLMKIIELMEA